MTETLFFTRGKAYTSVFLDPAVLWTTVSSIGSSKMAAISKNPVRNIGKAGRAPLAAVMLLLNGRNRQTSAADSICVGRRRLPHTGARPFLPKASRLPDFCFQEESGMIRPVLLTSLVIAVMALRQLEQDLLPQAAGQAGDAFGLLFSFLFRWVADLQTQIAAIHANCQDDHRPVQLLAGLHGIVEQIPQRTDQLRRRHAGMLGQRQHASEFDPFLLQRPLLVDQETGDSRVRTSGDDLDGRQLFRAELIRVGRRLLDPFVRDQGTDRVKMIGDVMLSASENVLRPAACFGPHCSACAFCPSR